MLPIVAIVGRPNVGKSTLFNRIIEDRLAITDDKPGVTRDRIYSKATWLDKEFRIIDTGGIEISDAPFLTEIKAQAEIAIEEADVIIFTVDARDGLLPGDKDVMTMLYNSKKPVIVAVNKVDNQKYKDSIFDFYELGADKVINISSAHGIGIGDLLDSVISYFPDDQSSPYDEDDILLSIIGRPNVGKSSLTNAILGYERVIVSDVEGTTTDSVDTEFYMDDQKYVVIDTAGMKKRGKIYENLDRYANLRAMHAIDRSDVSLLVLDAETGIRQLDKNIAGYAIENRKAMIVVVNKWDAIKRDQYTMKTWEDKIRQEFRFLKYIPIVFVSALTKARIRTIFPVIRKAYENYSKRVSTSLLNETIQDATLLNPPKPVRSKTVRVYYATQTKAKCPTFIIFVNDTEAMHFSYKRYLENKLREKFDFFGTPINIILRKRT